jgi:hypothetical protein
MWVEVFRNGELVTSGIAGRSLFTRAVIKFMDLPQGSYLVKIFWQITNETRFYNGYKVVDLKEDTKVHVFCAWQRTITVTVYDQHGNGLEGASALLMDTNGVTVTQNTTDNNGEVILKAPSTLRSPYTLSVYYNGFTVYEGELTLLEKTIELPFELYDLTVEIKDVLDRPPGVSLTPILSSPTMNVSIELQPQEVSPGVFVFHGLPAALYRIQIIYGNIVDETSVNVPGDGETISLTFTATFHLTTQLFDARGNTISDQTITLAILRDGDTIHRSLDPQKPVTLPPGVYTIKAYTDNGVIGMKNVELASDRSVNLVTTLAPLSPVLTVWAGIIIAIGGVLLLLGKKVSLPVLLLLVAFACVIIAVVQPWWGLTGSSMSPAAEQGTELFLMPPVMIETTTYKGVTTLDLAITPDIFVDFLGIVLWILYAGAAFLLLSCIAMGMRWRKQALLLLGTGTLLVMVVLVLFYGGMSTLTEASVGALYGDKMLSMTLDETVISMDAQWGLSSGFYLCLISVLCAFVASIFTVKSIKPGWFSLKKQYKKK